MPQYDELALKELESSLASALPRSMHLIEGYLSFPYRHKESREYASHGFARRVQTAVHCIKRVFELIPPDQDGFPNYERLIDATVFMQSFIFNVFGSLDNIARIWVYERDIKNRNGSELNRLEITFRKDTVRKTLPVDFGNYVDSLAPWIEHLEGFRHGLAHRIPLYIPPYVVPEENNARYAELEERKFRSNDTEEYRSLTSEQLSLATFQPLMAHSFSEGSAPVHLHSQVLADFNTLEEIGQKFLHALHQ